MLHCKCIILRIHKTIKNDKNDIFKSEIGSANLKKYIKKQYYKSYNKYSDLEQSEKLLRGGE